RLGRRGGDEAAPARVERVDPPSLDRLREHVEADGVVVLASPVAHGDLLGWPRRCFDAWSAPRAEQRRRDDPQQEEQGASVGPELGHATSSTTSVSSGARRTLHPRISGIFSEPLFITNLA